MSIETVRYLIGDTDTSNQLLPDAIIDFFLTEAGNNVYLAASLSADACAAAVARDVSNSQTDSHGVHNLSRSSSDKFKHFKDLASMHMARYKSGAGSSDSGSAAATLTVFAGGISQSDKRTRASDGDRVTPAFSRQLHDNPGKMLTGDLDE